MELRINEKRYSYRIFPLSSRRRKCCVCGELNKSLLVRIRKLKNSDYHFCHKCLIKTVLGDHSTEFQGDQAELAGQIAKMCRLEKRNFKSDGTRRADALPEGVKEYKEIRRLMPKKVVEAIDAQ